jgi:hypothetical protein
MKNCGLVRASLAGLLATSILGLALGAASRTPQVAASKKTQSVSPTITIRGVLVKEDKTPLAWDPLSVVLVTAAAVTGEGEDGVSYELTNEGINKNTVHPDAKGRFTIKVERSSLTSKKLVILIGGTGFGGLQPLKQEDKSVIIEVNDKSSTVNLGTIIVKGR